MRTFNKNKLEEVDKMTMGQLEMIAMNNHKKRRFVWLSFETGKELSKTKSKYVK